MGSENTGFSPDRQAMPLAFAQWPSLSVRTNVFVAERREPPGEYPSDLPTVTGQLALFRYKVSAIWLSP